MLQHPVQRQRVTNFETTPQAWLHSTAVINRNRRIPSTPYLYPDILPTIHVPVVIHPKINLE
jgi:hypothetical protein